MTNGRTLPRAALARWARARALPPPREGQDRFEIFGDLFLFFAPLTLFIQVNLTGTLYLSELLLCGALPFLLVLRGKMLKAPLPRTALILGGLWLASQVATDLIHGSAFEDYSRGWAKIGFTLLEFCAFYLLIDNKPRRFVITAVALASSVILAYLIAPWPYAIADPWKFALGNPVALLVAALVMWKPIERTWLLPSLLLGGLGVFSLFQGFRSLAGVLAATAAYLLFARLSKLRPGRRRQSSMVMPWVYVAGGSAIAWAFLGIYGYMAEEGILGREARVKYEVESAGQYGVLLGARGESFVSLQAIADSPIIGHGSWARGYNYRVRLATPTLEGSYQGALYGIMQDNTIPTHSYLLGAWVEAGVLGAVYWIWVLWLLVRILANIHRTDYPLLPLAALIALDSIWSVLFSPFGADTRIQWAFYLTVLCHAAAAVRRADLAQELRSRFR